MVDIERAVVTLESPDSRSRPRAARVLIGLSSFDLLPKGRSRKLLAMYGISITASLRRWFLSTSAFEFKFVSIKELPNRSE